MCLGYIGKQGAIPLGLNACYCHVVERGVYYSRTSVRLAACGGDVLSGMAYGIPTGWDCELQE
ncbi:MAG TPA: hypothetical protein VMX96_06330 [Dehalococcoidia bacterium]|nr:hypothetical protein [Dehalococcoidia bacterium]